MAILVIEHSARSGIQRLGRILRSYGHRLRYVRFHLGEAIPPDLDDVDGIVSCGGSPSANDDNLPWLDSEMQLLRQAHAMQMPIVGLCLGSQILARALGGEVAQMKGGPEVGWHEVCLTPAGREDPLHAGIGWRSIQAHFHYDAVTEPPPGAHLLASSDRCKVQAWVLGLRTYGFQYHPEIDSDSMAAIIDDDPELLTKSHQTRDQIVNGTKKYFPAFERITNRLFENIALLLMPVERRYHGLVKDLHH